MFASKTPAANRTKSAWMITNEPGLKTEGGPRRKKLNIFNDENPRRMNDQISRKQLFMETTQTIQTSHKINQSNKKVLINPLTDKTNTVKKKANKIKDDLKSPSECIKTNTPHPKTHKPLSTSSNSVERLIFRTPTTSKRARLPPPNEENSSDTDLESDGQISFNQSGLQFDLDGPDIPDPEYGPPTAQAEFIEVPEHNFDLSHLFNHPSQSRNLFFNQSMINEHQDFDDVLMEDGKKELWNCEPSVEITDYSGSISMDELFLPRLHHRSSLVTKKTSFIKPRPALSLNSKPQLKPQKSIMKKPSKDIKPIVPDFHQLINDQIRLYQSKIDSDLNEYLDQCSKLEIELSIDDFQFAL